MDRIDLIYDMLKMIQEDVADLKDFKNRLIGGSILCGGIFAFCFEIIKSWFVR